MDTENVNKALHALGADQPQRPQPSRTTAAMIRASCRFCHGKGCLNCDTLVDREYKRQFPEGPRALATLHPNDPEEVPLLRVLLEGAAAGQTPEEVAAIVEANAAKVRAIQEHLASSDRDIP
jgi:hypothetical protein